MNPLDIFTNLRNAVLNRSATAGVIGLGYVGLPMLAAIARSGFQAIGFDTDAGKVEQITKGHSYIGAVKSEELASPAGAQLIIATTDFSTLSRCDVIVICVPTPLTRNREPDLSYVEGTARSIAQYLRKGQLVVLESTTFPGTTREIVKPILE